MKTSIVLFISLALNLFYSKVACQVLDHTWTRIVHQPEGEWFGSEEALEIAENVLLYQRNIGGWPKNISMHKKMTDEDKIAVDRNKFSSLEVTTDNGATTNEMLFISKIYRQNPVEIYKDAFLRGLDYLLDAQYPNGGWPQFYPPMKGYYTHITYNDDSMINIMEVLKNLIENTNKYAIKPPREMIERAKIAFNLGVECILNTQYRQDSVLTSWCAQHDEFSLQPAKARSYELPSLSGKESAQIVMLLMSIEKPSLRIIESVKSAVSWFEKVKLTGVREERTFNENGKINWKQIVNDPNAPYLWARFMNLDDNKPYFCDRDGVKKDSYDQIGEERRNGYAWYTQDPQKVLDFYPKWLAKIESKTPKDVFNMVVAKDGSGDFTSIQEAINAAKAFPPQRVTIFIKNGVYQEKVKVHEWNTHLSLIGESKEGTIITFNDYCDKINLGRNSTFYTSTLLVEGDDFIAKNLTIENSAGDTGQAIALSVNSNRIVINNCKILGNQDTFYASGKGHIYLFDSYIEGTTDFIFGNATAVFEYCEIHSKKNSYITAASTELDSKFGFVFKNCSLTANDSISEVYLGRPWRKYAKTVFMNCEMGKHILPKGWQTWSNLKDEFTTYYAEYMNKGLGFQPEMRVFWSHQLMPEEAKIYTNENILLSPAEVVESSWIFKM